MATFKDRLGRTIKISVTSCDAFAHHNGKQVGIVETTGTRDIDEYTADQPAAITGMFVDNPYQKAGIGLELVRLLSEEIGMLVPARKNEGRGGENALTDAGLALTERAQALGYVSPFSVERPDEDD